MITEARTPEVKTRQPRKLARGVAAVVGVAALAAAYFANDYDAKIITRM